MLWSGEAAAGDLEGARRALAEGRYEAAAAALGRAESPREALLLARAKLAVGDRAGANAAVRRALGQLTPEQQGEALTLRGELEALEGQDEAALKTWARALELDPSARLARLRRGELLLRLGRKEEGRALLDVFADEYNEDPPRDSAGLLLVGVAVWRLEYYEDANSVLRDATEADAGNLEAWVAWGDLFLEKYNTEDASFAYEAALKRNPRYAPALLGMARVVLERDYDLKATQSWLDKALAVNPAMPEAIAMRAELQIDDGDYEGAQGTLREALKINPRHQEALWLLAACAWLRGDQKGYAQRQKAVFQVNPKDAAFLTQMARLAARVHRYQDAIAFSKEALKLDKDHWPAFVELGISYTRVGDDKQGQAFLTRAHENDPFHVRAFHMVNLYEQTLPQYRFVERGGVRFRFHKEEQAVLEEVIPPLASEAMAALGKRYRHQPRQPVHVEVFRDRETFSVRSVGLPNISPHGICFGSVVTAISPSAGDFNWAEVIWHELAHVHHLQLSGSQVPRWFTEGLAEFEAAHARSEWRREQDLELLSALREGRLLSVGALNHGFTHARSLVDVVNAYFQSALVIEFIESRWGFEAILKMLKGYGEGLETGAALKKVTGLDVLAFDAEFKRYLEARYAGILRSFEPSLTDSPEALLEEAARRPQDAGARGRAALALLWARRLDEAEASAKQALLLDPNEPNALYFMAFLEQRSGDVGKARARLEEMVRRGQDGYSVRAQLGALEERRGEPAAALRHYQAAAAFYPRGVEPWRAMARLAQGPLKGEEGLLIEALWQITELDQSDFEAAVKLARLERARGERANARRAVRRALQIRPFDAEAQRLSGELALEDKDAAGAVPGLRLALRLWRGGAAQERGGVGLKLARALWLSGDKAGARAALEQARASAPAHPELAEVEALVR